MTYKALCMTWLVSCSPHIPGVWCVILTHWLESESGGKESKSDLCLRKVWRRTTEGETAKGPCSKLGEGCWWLAQIAGARKAEIALLNWPQDCNMAQSELGEESSENGSHCRRLPWQQ